MIGTPVTTQPLIRRLMAEHAIIREALGVLKHTTRKSFRLRTALPDLQLLVRFFRKYGDEIHHYSEEEVLFPALERHSNGQLLRMTQRLGTQHVIGRHLVGQMAEALRKASAGNRGWQLQYRENAMAYHTLLTIHICDEDHLFFPAVDRSPARLPIRGPRANLHENAKHSLESSILKLSKKYGTSQHKDACATGCDKYPR